MAMLRDAPSGARQHEVIARKLWDSPYAEEARLGRLEIWAVSLDSRDLGLGDQNRSDRATQDVNRVRPAPDPDDAGRTWPIPRPS